jgi:hypothetical protein
MYIVLGVEYYWVQDTCMLMTDLIVTVLWRIAIYILVVLTHIHLHLGGTYTHSFKSWWYLHTFIYILVVLTHIHLHLGGTYTHSFTSWWYLHTFIYILVVLTHIHFSSTFSFNGGQYYLKSAFQYHLTGNKFKSVYEACSIYYMCSCFNLLNHTWLL